MDRNEQRICEEIYARYRNRIYRYIRKNFCDMPEADIHDVMQEIWLAMSAHIADVIEMDEQYRMCWLLTVSRYRCMDYYRMLKRERELGERLAQQYDERPGSSVEQIITGKLEGLDILESLSVSDRKVLADHYLGENLEMDRREAQKFACKNYRVQKKIRERMEGMDKKSKRKERRKKGVSEDTD